MTLYHRTTSDAAATILRDGFQDGLERYMSDRVFEGVWVSEKPFNINGWRSRGDSARN